MYASVCIHVILGSNKIRAWAHNDEYVHLHMWLTYIYIYTHTQHIQARKHISKCISMFFAHLPKILQFLSMGP